MVSTAVMAMPLTAPESTSAEPVRRDEMRFPLELSVGTGESSSMAERVKD